MYKRFLSIMLALTMVLCVSACANDDYSSKKNEETETSDVEEDKDNPKVTPKKVDDIDKIDFAPQDGENETSEEIENIEDEADTMEPEIIEIGSPEETLAFAANMKAGWNLGNTLDAYNDSGNNSGNDTETYWGNPKTTQAMIDAVKNQGFTTIRIPVSYHDHCEIIKDEAGNEHILISEEWLSRVKEVVDYAINDGLYVIINIHHDNMPVGKFGYIPDKANKEQALWYVSEIWKQVAPFFKDYDEHLIFEALNEPRLTNDPENEWWFNTESAHCIEAASVINELNQAFVDIVRVSGGNNPTRYLMVTGYCASVSGYTSGYFKLPKDTTTNRLMISLHAYVPYDFALNQDLSFDKFDEAAAEENLGWILSEMNNRFIKKGIPVVIGEYGCMEKNGNLSERIAYYKYYTKRCAEMGIPTIVWDNGIVSGNGERFGLLDRTKCQFVYKELADAIVNGYK